MDQPSDHRQAPEPSWSERHGDVEVIRLLKSRILELEAENKAYEALLADLPELFERKFQRRLEPLMERYRLLAEQVSAAEITGSEATQPALLDPAPDNVVRFPVLRLPRFLQRQRQSG